MSTRARGKAVVAGLTAILGVGSLTVTGIMSGVLLHSTPTSSTSTDTSGSSGTSSSTSGSSPSSGSSYGDSSSPSSGSSYGDSTGQGPSVQQSRGGQSNGYSTGS